MTPRRTDLSGVAVVVPVGTAPDADHAAPLAAELAAAGAAVVVVGPDAGALGAIAASLEVAGGRVAVHVGDPSAPETRGALVEQLAELFPATGDRPVGVPAPRDGGTG